MTFTSQYGRYIDRDNTLYEVNRAIDVKRCQVVANNVSHAIDTSCQQRVSYVNFSGITGESPDLADLSSLVEDSSYTVGLYTTPWSPLSPDTVASAVLYVRAHMSSAVSVTFKAGLFAFGDEYRPDLAGALATWAPVSSSATTATDIFEARSTITYSVRPYREMVGGATRTRRPRGTISLDANAEPARDGGTVAMQTGALLMTLAIFAKPASSVLVTLDTVQLWEVP